MASIFISPRETIFQFIPMVHRFSGRFRHNTNHFNISSCAILPQFHCSCLIKNQWPLYCNIFEWIFHGGRFKKNLFAVNLPKFAEQPNVRRNHQTHIFNVLHKYWTNVHILMVVFRVYHTAPAPWRNFKTKKKKTRGTMAQTSTHHIIYE